MALSPSNDSMGCVLILSNPYEKEGPPLHEQYAGQMEKLWAAKLGCELFEDKVHSNLTARDVMNVFERLANANASIYQYLIVVVIGNGGLLRTTDGSLQPFIEAKDGNCVQEKAFFSKFYNNNQAWREKPKLFILGYNRIGEMKQESCDDELRELITWDPEGNSRSNDNDITDNTCAKFSDLLVLYGSATDLMEKVNNVFTKRYTTDTLTQMLTRVNREMKKHGKWSVFESTIISPCTLFAPRNQGNIRDDGNNSSSSVRDDVDRAIETFTKRDSFGRKSAKANLIEYTNHLLKMLPAVATIGQTRNAIGQISKTPLKGRGVVISNSLVNEDNSKEKKRRKKYHITDKDKMVGLWRKELGCDIDTHLNKTAIDMKKILKELARSDSKGYEYLVVAVSSHGGLVKLGSDSNIMQDRDDIQRAVCFGVKEQPVCEREILAYFKGEESPWYDKVKLFIFDYCRGEKQELRVQKAEPAYPDIDYHFDEKVFYPDTLPLINKCVVVYATYYDHVAWSNDLIPTLADIFAENWDQNSVTEMLVMVNARMRDMEPREETKAMSVFKSTLDDEFYLYKEKETETGDI